MFRKLLKEKGFKIVEIRGDGNCLFRAVSHQVFLTEEHHGLLRKKCVEHLRGKIYHH
jgi:OTU domain-containing protein 5